MAKREGAFSGKRLARVLEIHRKLRTMRSFTGEQLVEACREADPEVHERTVAADIAFLRDVFKAPLPPRSNRWHHYQYEQAFSLFEGLDDTFAGTLQEVLALVRQLARKPEFVGLEDVLLRLEQRAGGLLGTPADERLQFDEPVLTGRERLPQLYRSILLGHTLDIEYQPFAGKVARLRTRPCLLREYNKRWFLLAWCDGVDRIQNYAVDRIQHVQTSAEPLPERPFPARTYFADLIGVTRFDDCAEPVTVRLRVTADRAGYVRTKKMHASQRETPQPDGSLLVELHVCLNRELEAKILELGADTAVLEPPQLRQTVANHLRRALEGYGEEGGPVDGD